jgi:hypothetical protein
MKLLPDAGLSTWLNARMGRFGLVSGVVGKDFEAYARILHPVDAYREDQSVIDPDGEAVLLERSTWKWSDVADGTGRVLRPDTSWGEVSGTEGESDVFLRGWRIEPPEKGWLDPCVLSRLVKHLTAVTAPPFEVVAAVWDGWEYLDGDARSTRASRMHLPNREYFLFSTTLPRLADPATVKSVLVGTFRGVGYTPQLLWGEDHSWLLATEIESDYTLIAGSRELINSVLLDSTLEAFEVDPGLMLP